MAVMLKDFLKEKLTEYIGINMENKNIGWVEILQKEGREPRDISRSKMESIRPGKEGYEEFLEAMRMAKEYVNKRKESGIVR